jgi:hypothetical protein
MRQTNSPQKKKKKKKKNEFGGSTWGGDPRRARRAAAAARRGAGAVRNRVRRCPRPGAHRSAGIGDAAGCAPRGWRIDCSAARGGARMPGPNRRASRCAGGQPGRDSGVGAVFFLLSILFFVCIFFCLFVCFQWFHRQGRSSPLDTVFFGFFFFFFFFFWNFRKCERSLTDPRLAALVAVAIAEFTARDPYRFPAHTDAMRSAWHEWEACAGGWSELQELAEAARGLRAHSFFFRFVWF